MYSILTEFDPTEFLRGMIETQIQKVQAANALLNGIILIGVFAFGLFIFLRVTKRR